MDGEICNLSFKLSIVMKEMEVKVMGKVKCSNPECKMYNQPLDSIVTWFSLCHIHQFSDEAKAYEEDGDLFTDNPVGKEGISCPECGKAIRNVIIIKWHKDEVSNQYDLSKTD